jgi:hypothetical protein
MHGMAAKSACYTERSVSGRAWAGGWRVRGAARAPGDLFGIAGCSRCAALVEACGLGFRTRWECLPC